jgi:hypothetical protein
MDTEEMLMRIKKYKRQAEENMKQYEDDSKDNWWWDGYWQAMVELECELCIKKQ